MMAFVGVPVTGKWENLHDFIGRFRKVLPILLARFNATTVQRGLRDDTALAGTVEVDAVIVRGAGTKSVGDACCLSR